MKDKTCIGHIPGCLAFLFIYNVTVTIGRVTGCSDHGSEGRGSGMRKVSSQGRIRRTSSQMAVGDRCPR